MSVILDQALKEWPKLPQHAWVPGLHTLLPDPASTGNQNDFGVSMLAMDLDQAEPYRLWGIQRSVYQEACRPMWHREPDGSPIRAKDHPDLVLHAGVPHGRSADQLGQPPEQWARQGAWAGIDQEHWSINHLCQLAWLGDPMARIMVDELCDLWMLSCPVGNGRGTTLHQPKPDRAQGRILWAGASLLKVTQREDVRNHLRALRDSYYKLPDRHGFVTPASNPIIVWAPWETAIKALGCRAAAVQLDGGPSQRAQYLAELIVKEGVVDDRVGYRAALRSTELYWEPGGDLLSGYAAAGIAIVDPDLAERMLSRVQDPFMQSRLRGTSWEAQ